MLAMNFVTTIKSNSFVKPIGLMQVQQVIALLQQEIPYEYIKQTINLTHNTLDEFINTYAKQISFLINEISSHYSNTHILIILYRIDEFNRKIKNQLIQKNWYSIFLIVFSYLMITVFYLQIYPTFLQFQTQTVSVFFPITYYFIQIIFIGSLLIMGTFTIILRPAHRQVLLLNWLYKKRPFHLVFIYYSYCLASILYDPLTLGYASAVIVNLLRNIPKWPYIRKCAYQLDQSCQQGEAFVDALSKLPLDPTYNQFVKLGSYHQKLAHYIKQYQQVAQLSLNHALDRFSFVLKSIAYGFVLMSIAFVFIILQIPLHGINQLL